MPTIKPINELFANRNNIHGRTCPQVKALMKLTPGQGFTTVKAKVPVVKAAAKKNGISIKTRSVGNGVYAIFRPAV